jgi:O-acetyl-ADP-ribose deacetylase (regulator of RNase III)
VIEIVTGDLLAADVEALVNPVNCVGVMGAGLSAGFKKKSPAAFTAYAKACKNGEVMPGRIFVFEAGERTIFHFPTKRHFRDPSRMEDIDSGLVALADEIQERGIRSIAIPALGCGADGLSWDDVRPRIEKALEGLGSVQVLLYEPQASDDT